MVLIVVGLALIAIGVVMFIFKPAFLVAGYNTASKEEREKIDADKLCRLVGSILLIAGLWQIIFGVLFVVTGATAFTLIGAFGLMAIVVAGVVYINTGDRTRK